MGYLVTILGVLATIGTLTAAMWQFNKPMKADIASLKAEMAEFRTEVRGEFTAVRREIREVDAKYDKKIDQIRVEIFNLARGMGVETQARPAARGWRGGARTAA